MTERPILFSGPMVRALLDGRKTQTRRAVKGVPSFPHHGRDIMDWGLSGIHQDEAELDGTDRWALDVQTDVDDHSRRLIRCPYGAPGDTLWVRETWSHTGEGVWTIANARSSVLSGRLVYRATDDNLPAGSWWPSIHMPREFSRITLRITDVRVERLNDISEEDALAEGVVWSERWQSFVVSGVEHPNKDFPVLSRATARGMYAALWDTINGSGAWLANPWVWAVSCERVGP